LKIAFPMFGLGRGGGEKVIVRLADSLVDRGHSVSLFVPSGQNPGIVLTRASVQEYPHLPLVPHALSRTGIDTLSLTFPLAKRLRAFDVLVANFAPTSLPTKLGQDMKTRLCYLVQHDDAVFFSRMSLNRWLSRLSYGMLRNGMFFTVSQWLREMIRQKTGCDSVILHPGIDHQTYHPRERLTHGGKQVLFLARASKFRGIEYFIDAMNIVAAKVPDVRLLGVGKALQGFTPRCPIEYVTPSDDQLATLYASSDVFVLPSILEGMPVPPLEAMASGGCVVLTDCLGTRDYANDGENCLMVPPKDSGALAEAIVNVLTDEELNSRLRINGPVTAQEWTYERMSKPFVEGIESLDQP